MLELFHLSSNYVTVFVNLILANFFCKLGEYKIIPQCGLSGHLFFFFQNLSWEGSYGRKKVLVKSLPDEVLKNLRD